MMKYLVWILFGLIVSCSAQAQSETWIMQAIAINAVTGEVLGTERIRAKDGTETWKNGPDCVKAALEMGPIPVHNGVAISIVCHKVDSV